MAISTVSLRKIKRRSDSKKWLWLDYYAHGKRVREPLSMFVYEGPGSKTASAKTHNRATLNLAEEIRAKRQTELQSDDFNIDSHFKREGDFVEFFATLALQRHKSWRSTLLHIRAFVSGPVPFRAIDETWIDGFTAYLLDQVSANTASTYLAKVKAALNIAIRRKIIRENPCRFARPLKKGAIKRTFITQEQLQKLALTPCPDAEVRRAFLFACYTGLRLSDVKKLKWAEVTGRLLRIVQKKTGESLSLPLNDTAIQLLGSPKSSGSLVFHLPASDWYTWDILRRWSEHAEIGTSVSFHVSRRTFATLSLSSHTDIYTVSKLLGQTEIRSTQLYVRLLDPLKEEAMNRLPRIQL